MDLKELLLKDLSARLPYHVVVNTGEDNLELVKVDILNGVVYLFSESFLEFDISEVKPYLRPMSSITEEEIKELSEIDQKRVIFSSRHLTWHLDGEVIDYLNKKMFDWRDLIRLGLAIDCTNMGIYD